MKKFYLHILLAVLIILNVISPLCFASSAPSVNAEACILMDYDSRKNYL